jgi:hypothetical protein
MSNAYRLDFVRLWDYWFGVFWILLYRLATCPAWDFFVQPAFAVITARSGVVISQRRLAWGYGNAFVYHCVPCQPWNELRLLVLGYKVHAGPAGSGMTASTLVGVGNSMECIFLRRHLTCCELLASLSLAMHSKAA